MGDEDIDDDEDDDDDDAGDVDEEYDDDNDEDDLRMVELSPTRVDNAVIDLRANDNIGLDSMESGREGLDDGWRG